MKKANMTKDKAKKNQGPSVRSAGASKKIGSGANQTGTNIRRKVPASNGQLEDHGSKESPRLVEARKYLSWGIHTVPIAHMSKAPKQSGWQKLRIKYEELPVYFDGAGNIGALLGDPSGGLIDIDLDSTEAIILASDLLPPAQSIFGRESKPASHFLYRVNTPLKTTQYKNIDGKMLVELRSTGGQTVVPPSVHPSAETVAWHKDGEPTAVDALVIQQAVSRLAAAALLVRNYPESGSRNDLSVVVANLLIRAKFEEDDAERFLVSVASAAGDEETNVRGKAAHYAFERHKSGLPSHGLPHLATLIDERAAKKFVEFLGLRHSKPGKASQAETGLGAMLEQCELWHIAEGRSYATFEVKGHREHWPVKSTRFRNYARSLITGKTGKMPSGSALDEVIDMSDGMAQMGPVYDVAIRSMIVDGTIYVDLVNDECEAIEITAHGWRIVSDCPLRFVRSRGMLPLPMPVEGGQLDDLRRHFNVGSDDDFWLLIALIICAYRGQGPYAIAAISGEQGSAKSTAVRMIRDLIDPNNASARALPRKEDDLYVAASNGFILSFDNVSSLHPDVSDTLCRISTGGGFSKRELYSDLEEVIVDVCRPILLNGIPFLVDRADLMDRTIALTLPSIPPDKRKTEKVVWREFTEDRPRMLGAIFSALSAGLRHVEEIEITDSPRLIDLVTFMTAVERGLELDEGRFHRIYSDHQRQSRIDFAASDPLVGVIEEIIKHGEYSGTATDLMTKVRAAVDSKHSWWPTGVPKAPNRLAGALRRLTPALRELGIEVILESGRDEVNRKVIHIFREGGGKL